MNSPIDLSNITESLKNLSEDSRLWIFQSNRMLDDAEVNFAQNMLNEFLSKWTSHNNELLAVGKVALKHFIVIGLDESKSSQASGCSIDSMTHQIQNLAVQLKADLMDRSTFYFIIDSNIQGIGMSDLSTLYQENKVNDTSLVFNNLIKTKKELTTGWILPLKESWHSRFI